MKRLVVLQFVLLIGCAGQGNPDKPRDPVIVAGPEVKVGVREKCVVELPDEPKWETRGPVPPDDLERSKAVLIELKQHQDWWENTVKPALEKCK